jgi:FtsP/CotA-like multicopper oxidase with cupredoxin domain
MEMHTMYETTIHTSTQTRSTTRREGTFMAIKSTRKRWVATAVAIAGLAGSAVVAHAATFSDVVLAPVAPATFPVIAPTCTASCSIDLLAGTGSVAVNDTVNGVQNVPFYGFGVNGSPASLAGSPNSTIKVPQGSTLTITLSQSGVSDPIDLSFPSIPAGDVSHVGNVYTVNANKVGTSVFQPGTNPDAPRQVAMGLVGVLIVTPTECASPALSCAYDGSVSYDDEALVATTDLDYEFAIDPSAFDMGYFGQSPNPEGTPRRVYHVINGKAFPDTDVIDVRAGDSVLLRTVNAGVTDKSLGSLGMRQTLLARNASQYTDPQTFIAPLVGPGETADIVVSVPADAVAGQRYSLMDQGRQMNHGNAYGFGGALTFFAVWPTVTTP